MFTFFKEIYAAHSHFSRVLVACLFTSHKYRFTQETLKYRREKNKKNGRNDREMCDVMMTLMGNSIYTDFKLLTMMWQHNKKADG